MMGRRPYLAVRPNGLTWRDAGPSGAAGRVFAIGGPEVPQYITMLRRVAVTQGRTVMILPVPLLTPGLSSLWLTLVTDVDTATGRALIDSMTNEVVVRDHSIRDPVPFDPIPYDAAVRKALDERSQAERAAGDRRPPDRWWRPVASPSEARSRCYPALAPRPADATAARARRRRVVMATSISGTGLLGVSLSTKPGSPWFCVLTMGVAGTWAAGPSALDPSSG